MNDFKLKNYFNRSLQVFGFLLLLTLYSSCKKERQQTATPAPAPPCPDEVDFKVLWRQPRDSFSLHDSPVFLKDQSLVYRTWWGFADRFIVRDLVDGQLISQEYISTPGLSTSTNYAVEGKVHFNSYVSYGIYDPLFKSVDYIPHPFPIREGLLYMDGYAYMLAADTSFHEYLIRLDISTRTHDTVKVFDHFKPRSFPEVLLHLIYVYAEENGDHVIVLKQDSEAGYSNFARFVAINSKSKAIQFQVHTGEIKPSWTIHSNAFFCYYEWAGSFYAFNISKKSPIWTYKPPVPYDWSGFKGISGEHLIIDRYPGIAALDKENGTLQWTYTQNEEPLGPVIGFSSRSLVSFTENQLIELDQGNGCLIEKLSITPENLPVTPIEKVVYFEEPDILIVFTKMEVLALQKG